MSLPSFVDVAIVGAGAAGIAAARALSNAPLSVAVLEGRDRIGGRAWTVWHAGESLDIGCGWLHSADENPLAALVEDRGLTLDKTPPPWMRQAFDLEFPPADQTAFGEAFDAFETRVAAAAEQGVEGPASDLFETGNRWNPLMDAISGALNGARFTEVSTQDSAAYRDTGVNWRVREGYGRLIAGLGADLPLMTGVTVTRIDRTGPDLALDTTAGRMTARAVIVTVPTGLIASGALRIDPAPQDWMEAAAGLPLGLATKLHMDVADARDFPEDAQLWGRRDTPQTGGYHLRPFGRPMIEGYFGGDLAWGLEIDGPAAFFDFGVEEMVRLLGSSMRRRLTFVNASMWGADPFSGGAYSHALPHHADDRAHLALPLDGQVFFAGEATSADFYGTAHGAWIEGERAADRVVAALGLAPLSTPSRLPE